jgi:2-polyprenyl-3-methyl-5-hydroxy-6-metoxy-1,4-benzoquinol methylase
MRNNIEDKIIKSEIFLNKNNIFIQNEDSISMFDVNKKEKEAMDRTVNIEKKLLSNLENYYNNYSTNKIVEQNTLAINSLNQGEVAIDCGCGKGEYLKVLSSKFNLVIAIDLSLEAILYAKETNKNLNNIIYIAGSMLDFYKVFNEPIADFCLSAEVVEHVPSPDEYLNNIYSLLKKDGELLISTPSQNLYFYPMQFFSMILTKPKTLYKLLNPLEHWYFALDWHPAMSKKVFLGLLQKHSFEVKSYKNFLPYYFDKLPLVYTIAKIMPTKYALGFYKNFLTFYNLIIEKVGFGIRQHSLVIK